MLLFMLVIANKTSNIYMRNQYHAIVGTHSTLFRYTPYIPWEIWLAKSRFHEYARGQSSTNEIACYNKILFNLNDVTSCPASSVGRAADRCTDGRGFKSHAGN